MAFNHPREQPARSMHSGSVGLSIPALFEQTAAACPQRVAIGTGSWQPTYAELSAATDLFAGQLKAGHPPGGRVALLQRVDGFLVGSILAVLKAGQVVAALNPADPPARLRDGLLDVEPWIILAEPATRELAEQVAPPGVPVAVFPDASSFDAKNPLFRAHAPEGPEDLAFLIPTSGSTGRPKRVMLTQRVVMASVARHHAAMQTQPEDRILLLASSSTLQALGTIFCAVLYGATVCPFPVAEKSIIGLGEWLRRHNITVYVSAASAFRNFLKTLAPDERFPSVRLVRLASEAILGSDLRTATAHFRDDCVYYCSYNCSEAGNVMQNRISRGDSMSGFRVPLGNPAPDTEISLCDESGVPVSDGEIGEIVVRSKFLSPGYWRDERLTSERFTAAGADGTRGYRTGDLARREPDGAVSYVGRRDDVVKIRGSRVILGEVERNIRSLPGVQESVVLARPLPDGSVRLTAFVVACTDKIPEEISSAETIRNALSALLPNYMVPGEYVFLDRLPLNANGKVDRGALVSRAASDAPLPPDDLATPTEVLLSPIWEEVLGGRASRQANFFSSGGDSLTAGVVAAKVHAALGVELDMLDFAAHPHLSDLAAAIDRLSEARLGEARLREAGLREDVPALELPPIERAPRRSPYDLSFTQQSIWRHCQQSAQAHRNYSSARSYGLRGPLDVEALRDAMTSVARRNEILRTTFSIVDGKPVQIVHPPEPVALTVVDLSGHSDAHEKALALFRQETGLIDLERWPLLRFKLLRIAPDEHWLVRLGHHILYDGLSWNLYFRELEAEYLSILQDRSRSPGSLSPESIGLPSKNLQYGDYAVWERSVFSPGSGFRSRLVDWWKSALADQPARMAMPFRRRPLFWRRVKPSDGWIWNSVDPAVRARLGDLARRESTTDYAIGLAAFAALLAVVTRRNKIIVGAYVTNRGSAALQNMFGDFARTLPVCLDYPGGGTFLEWLLVVRKQIVGVQAHAQLPREELWEDLRSRGVTPPEIEVIFCGPRSTLPAKFGEMDLTIHSRRFPGAKSEHIPATMPWGFFLCLDLKNEEYQYEVAFDAGIYHPAKVRSFLQSYLRLLDGLSLAPEQPMEKLIGAALAK